MPIPLRKRLHDLQSWADPTAEYISPNKEISCLHLKTNLKVCALTQCAVLAVR